MVFYTFQKLPVGYFILIGVIISAIGCAHQNYNPNIQRGSNYKFQDGHPQVRLTATEVISSDNNSKINIAADILQESLVFKESEGYQKAQISVDIYVTNEDKKVINKRHYDIEIDSTKIHSSSQSFIFERQLKATPSAHQIDFAVTDKNSGKQTTRTTKVSIPDYTKDRINLTNISMAGKYTGAKSSWVPITTYDVPSRIDSLMFRFQVTNNSAEEPLSINTRLLKINSDNSVARPTFYKDYSSSTTEYNGINYDDKTVVEKTTRKIFKKGNVFIEFYFGQLEKGNYRFEIETQKEAEIFKARDFGVKSKNYPSVQSPRELARPLIYLMDDNNYENLLSIKNQDSLKIAIDEFWLKKIGNQEEAQRALEKFYNRVEEANKQFSNFKEGWKTDPGMIYILFGRPDFVQHSMNEMTWNYSKNTVTSSRTFHFNKPTIKGSSFPFDHYLLQRKKSYYSLVYQQKQLWLSGLILQRDL